MYFERYTSNILISFACINCNTLNLRCRMPLMTVDVCKSEKLRSSMKFRNAISWNAFSKDWIMGDNGEGESVVKFKKDE